MPYNKWVQQHKTDLEIVYLSVTPQIWEFE